MLGHFEKSPGSGPAATADITTAEPAVSHPSETPAARSGPCSWAIARPTSHARPFSPQDLLDSQEWAESGEFG